MTSLRLSFSASILAISVSVVLVVIPSILDSVNKLTDRARREIKLGRRLIHDFGHEFAQRALGPTDAHEQVPAVYLLEHLDFVAAHTRHGFSGFHCRYDHGRPFLAYPEAGSRRLGDKTEYIGHCHDVGFSEFLTVNAHEVCVSLAREIEYASKMLHRDRL